MYLGRTVVFLNGGFGAGKSTHGKAMQKATLDSLYIATGDLCRAAAKAGNEQIQGLMQKRAPVPDSIILKLLEETVKKADYPKVLFLDGVPRHVPQAVRLSSFLAKGYSRWLICHYHAKDTVMVERQLHRAKLDAQAGQVRPDADPKAIEAGMTFFRNHNHLVLDYFKSISASNGVEGLPNGEGIECRVYTIDTGENTVSNPASIGLVTEQSMTILRHHKIIK
jgi:adenylate kinase family enzyme